MNAPDKDASPRRDHWEGVYASQDPERVSWYRETLEISLDLIAKGAPGAEARLIDVGGGASTLVDHLLDRGYRKPAVLDIAGAALQEARTRLGARAGEVVWLEQDVTRWRPDALYDVWHDRAVFHFLTEPQDRTAYVAAMERALTPRGRAILATFAPEGPEKCSGLPVVRYSPETLAAALGPAFALAEFRHETHITPGGVAQAFVYCSFVRR